MKHFHIYFEQHQQDELHSLLEITRRYFPTLYYGRIHTKPVGPHPIGSCLIATKTEQETETLLGFLKQHHNNLTLMIHPLTGDDIEDHKAENIIWLGQEYQINRSIFYPKPTHKYLKP